MRDDEDLVDRVRAALSSHGPLREVTMFGGLSFMVDDRMVVAVRADEELLVRADPARAGQLLLAEGAGTAEMGAGRTMSSGWISVSAEAIATDEGPDFWIAVALEFYHRQAGSTGCDARRRRGSPLRSRARARRPRASRKRAPALIA